MNLNYYLCIHQIRSGLVVSVVKSVSCVVGSNPTVLRNNFFFYQIEETCTFMNISSLNYHLSVIQKQKTVLPCVNFIKGERGYGRWDLMLNLKIYLLVFFAPYLDSFPVVCILNLTRRTEREKRNRRGCEG